MYQSIYKIASLFCSVILLVMLYPNNVVAQSSCPDGEYEILVEIVPDSWASSETSWEVLNTAGIPVISGTDEGGSFCTTLEEACLTFNIYDTYGDGLINEGGYQVFFDGNLVTSGDNFGYFASYDFGECPDGYSCHFPIDIFSGNSYYAVAPNTWYRFVPDTSGRFLITTCNTLFACNTGIWMYDYCDNLPWANNMEASIYYSTEGCDPHASLMANLQKDEVYYLRIGDISGSCIGNPIYWDIEYDGPISGCTDPLACNYDPVATVNIEGSCLYPGDPACPNGPDLIVVQSELESSLSYSTLNNTDGCYIEEGCMSGYGVRDLLWFTTHIKNIGNQDYYIGVPPASPSGSDEQWEWDPCHSHWHYEGYAEYMVYDANGQEIPVGFKNGFCVMDLECSDGGTYKYNCGNQGISAGCGDIYHSSLGCQWVDITNLSSGIYTLVVRVNWDQSPDALGRIELDHYNNWAQVCIELTRDDEGNIVSVTQVTDCEPYTDCLGEIYGTAQIDCEGNCGGQKLIGDLEPDGIYHTNDVFAYMTGIVSDDLTASACNDLNGDAQINIADAALLLSCFLQNNGTHTHPGGGTAHNHCNFPTPQIINPFGLVSVKLENINPEENYVDIYVMSPVNYLVAYQLQISGLQIAGVIPILEDPLYNADILFNPEGTILGVSVTESRIDRYLEFMPFLRVYYSAVTEEQVCLSVTGMINDNYEETVVEVVSPCLPAFLLTDITPDTNVQPGNVKILPNPFSKTTMLYFTNTAQHSFTLQISGIDGKVVKTYYNITASNIEIDLSQLPSGIYLYRLMDGKTIHTGKLVSQ